MEIKTKFDVGQKVWFLFKSDHASCLVEGEILSINATQSSNWQCVKYELRYYEDGEYLTTDRYEYEVFTTQEELLDDIRSRVLKYFELEPLQGI